MSSSEVEFSEVNILPEAFPVTTSMVQLDFDQL
jgi:hypothetical protein